MTRAYLAACGLAFAFFTASVARAQKDPTFSPTSVTIKGLGATSTATITITSPYDDCTMTITATSTDPSIVTVSPPGPISNNAPVTFTLTAGKRGGSAAIVFLFGSDPAGCVLQHAYTIPVFVSDPGAHPPYPPINEKQVIEPISMADGAYLNDYPDLTLRGPLPITFERYYNSTLASEGNVTSGLGPNWMDNWDISLSVNGASATVVSWLGQVITFSSSGSTWTQTSANPFQYQLLQNGTTYRMLDRSSKLIYTFNGTNGQPQSIQDRNGNTLTLTYNSSGQLTKVADGLGASLAFSYIGSSLTRVTDQSGRFIGFNYNGLLSGVTDPTGRSTVFTYSGSFLLAAYTLPRGNVPYTQTYDNNGAVSAQKDAAGNNTTFSFPGSAQTSMTNPLGQTSNYTSSGRNLVQETDPAGHSTSYTYDPNSRQLTRRDANGNSTTFTYQSAGLIATTTNADGGQFTYTYTASTNSGFTFYDLTSVAYPDGTTETFQYDSNGNLTGRIDRNGKQWQSTYNSHGQLLTATAPDGSKTTFTYSQDGASVPTGVQYPDGSSATFTVDSLKRIVSKKFADGSTVAYTYDSNDHILTATNQVGAVTTFNFDANGLLSSITDPTGGVMKLTRTGTDKLATTTDAAGNVTTYAYDSVDRPNSVTYADGSAYTVTYDSAGNATTLTDGEGKVWKAGYDSTGAQTSFTTPLGGQWLTTLDLMSRPVKTASAAGNTYTFTYDQLDRLIKATDALQNPTTYTYDKNGNLTGIAIPAGISAGYTRDPFGSLTGITDPNGNTWGLKFDPFGNLLALTDPLGQATTYARDAQGRVSQAKLPLGTMTPTLDAAGHITHAAFSDGTALDFTWDSVGRLTAATGLTTQYSPAGAVTSSNGLGVARDKRNRIAQITFAANKSVAYTYDRRGLVTQISDWMNGSTTFKYDDAGRLVSIARPNAVTTTYTYDADGNITGIQETGASTQSSIALTRDPRGFVTQSKRNIPLAPTAAQLGAVQAFHTVDSAGQIAEFQYDAMGRRTSDDTRSYKWDLASRVGSYSTASDSASFTYNALGLIASQTHGGATRQYVWNYALDLPSISVARSGSADQTYYVHTPDGRLLYSVDAASGKRSYYHFDEAGTTLFLTDDTGAIGDKYAYTEYGALLSPTATDNPFLFQGRYGAMQLGSGLYAMRARIYDSLTGAFLSRDPQVHIEPRLISPYEYSAGNPLAFRDVTGNEPGATTPGVTGGGINLPWNSATSLGGPFVVTLPVVPTGIPAIDANQPGTLGGPIVLIPTVGGPGSQTGLSPYPFTQNPFLVTSIPPTAAGGFQGHTIGLPQSYGNFNAANSQSGAPPTAPQQQQAGPKVPPPAPQSGASGNPVQTGNGNDTPEDPAQRKKSYEDVKRRIIELYKKGRITAIQRNNLMLYAKRIYEDVQ